MGIRLFPSIAQMLLTEGRGARQPVQSMRWCDGEIEGDRRFIPYPTPNEQTMEAWEKCGLQEALAWVLEGAILNNSPIKPTDIRNANAKMISLSAVMNDRRRWHDDQPADQNPFNPENRDRMLDLIDIELAE